MAHEASRARNACVNPTSCRVTACGALRLFARVRLCMLASARARRRARPARGSNGWPFAALRVPCGTRSSGPAHNSLRSLRSLRSNTCAESDDEARQMRARPEDLRSSAAPIRPAQAPPAALRATASACEAALTAAGSATRHPGRAQRACAAPSSAGFEARARSALRALLSRIHQVVDSKGLSFSDLRAIFGRGPITTLTRCVCSTTVSAANGGSYATGPRARAAQGSRSEAKTASPARWALPGCLVAAPRPTMRKFKDRTGPIAEARFVRRELRDAQWSH